MQNDICAHSRADIGRKRSEIAVMRVKRVLKLTVHKVIQPIDIPVELFHSEIRPHKLESDVVIPV